MKLTQGYMLRRVRILVALVAWVVLTWGLVTCASTVPELALWLESVQFMPAAMTFSLTTVAMWVGATLVFGRIYCSTMCPLGAWQDACARIVRLTPAMRRRRHFHYSRPLTQWRYISLAVVMVSIVLGIAIVVRLFDPWSIYSRACEYCLKPLCAWTVNQFRSPAVVVSVASAAGIVSALVIILGIGWVASRHGRTFCNSLCPVGTALGCVSRYSIVHIDINPDLCTQCRECEHVCKASCIDLVSHVVDGSRCVTCFDCLDVCPAEGAIRYTVMRHRLATPMMQRLSAQPS